MPGPRRPSLPCHIPEARGGAGDRAPACPRAWRSVTVWASSSVCPSPISQGATEEVMCSGPQNVFITQLASSRLPSSCPQPSLPGCIPQYPESILAPDRSSPTPRSAPLWVPVQAAPQRLGSHCQQHPGTREAFVLQGKGHFKKTLTFHLGAKKK